jgi:hypothetical protein
MNRRGLKLLKEIKSEELIISRQRQQMLVRTSAEDQNTQGVAVSEDSSSSSFTGFYNPLAGFSFLILEVSRSHTMTHHSR